MSKRRRKLQILFRIIITIIMVSALALYLKNKRPGDNDTGIPSSNQAEETDSYKASDIPVVHSDTEYKYTVCIDAGHGGKDVGATGTDGSYEKDDNLELALLVAAKLEEENINVILTRADDIFVDLSERSSIANRTDAELFVSLHRNYIENHSEICGVEIWIKNSNPTDARNAAEAILNELDSAGISKNLGIKTGTQGDANDNYTVLDEAEMPGLIIEMGYMSNEKDLSDFKSNKSSYADAIACGIINYLENSGTYVR